MPTGKRKTPKAGLLGNKTWGKENHIQEALGLQGWGVYTIGVGSRLIGTPLIDDYLASYHLPITVIS